MVEKIRILLVDDHPVLRSGLKALLELEDDLDVVAEAADGEEALERAQSLRPDVIIMDLDLPGMDGLVATRKIIEQKLPGRVLVLTSLAEEKYLMPVLEAGGHGFVHKTGPEEELFEAIRTVARDEVFLYPRSAKLLLTGFRKAEEAGEADAVEVLSDREREVLALAAEGYTSQEIAKKLYLSPKTVDTYRSRVMQKLGLAHRSDLVHFALKTGLLKTPD